MCRGSIGGSPLVSLQRASLEWLHSGAAHAAAVSVAANINTLVVQQVRHRGWASCSPASPTPSHLDRFSPSGRCQTLHWRRPPRRSHAGNAPRFGQVSRQSRPAKQGWFRFNLNAACPTEKSPIVALAPAPIRNVLVRFPRRKRMRIPLPSPPDERPAQERSPPIRQRHRTPGPRW